MTQPEMKRKTLVLGPNEHRLAEPLDVLGEIVRVKLSGADTNGAAAMVHVTVPKLSGPPLHRHSREDEWFYVLQGEITFEVDGQRFNATQGASAFAPRGAVHAFQNFHDDPAQLLVLMNPAGAERFFEDIHALNKGMSEPDFARVELLMQSYGIELLGPPLS
ncbi:MAG: cupin domain-containing protein [Bryobacteraceae bacterium]|nr:cupin domain-containing protein [Bryobacteraceae bacterium]